MKLKAISVDDEPRAHHVIRHYVDKIEELELMETFTSPLKAASYLKEQQVDLIFLDINMPDMDGMSLLKALKNPPTVIFTTAYDEYAVESYDHEAAGYLLKPIEFPRFYKAVMRVLEHKRQAVQPGPQLDAKASALLLKNGTKMLKLDSADIRYITASGNYAEVFMQDEKVIVDHSLSELMEEFLPGSFIRIHRSTIINADYLQEYESWQVKVADKKLAIGKTYRKEVKAFFEG
ncbi:LytR/AlgR family response regulator transcription factor [Gracilimonas mengyeensis]|uniref:Two component transcriptional regulator, LytTR family n=1 Tax=Gracilimonas mengyeensis TaxID=1302730 RepID=A0A521CFM1_9BACT|nr:LytTR family DNA-binding domain-containing protein [Gracilimonas mengyeensis]SMO58165.1 two component transcriptional regulator, LytTR family [Gracilimonas mengyeensis]